MITYIIVHRWGAVKLEQEYEKPGQKMVYVLLKDWPDQVSEENWEMPGFDDLADSEIIRAQEDVHVLHLSKNL